MSIAFEAFLVRLYTDATLRRRFLADARGEAARAGLGADEIEALVAIDRVGLALAAESYARKRAGPGPG
jgi:hypothetical protein